MSGALSGGVALANMAMAVRGEHLQSKESERQALEQAAWHDYNAKVAMREKESQDAANLFASKQQKKKAENLLSSQRTLIGASGVEMTGSPLLFAENTAVELAKEEQNIRLTGQRKSMAYKSQSILDISKADAARASAKGYSKSSTWSWLTGKAKMFPGGSLLSSYS